MTLIITVVLITDTPKMDHRVKLKDECVHSLLKKTLFKKKKQKNIFSFYSLLETLMQTTHHQYFMNSYEKVPIVL